MRLVGGGASASELAVRTNSFKIIDLFANGEKGGIWLPEYSSTLTPGNTVQTVTDISPNAVNLTQGTSANRPTLRQNSTTGAYYWEFDGTTNSLSSAISLSTTDTVTLWVFARKRADTAGVLAEFGATTSTNGGFGILHSSGAAANYQVRSRGTTSVSVTSPNDYAAPHSAVLTMQGEIVPANLTGTINGVVPTGLPSTSSQGTGNYSNLTLYVGARAGTSVYSSSDIYGVVLLGRTATAAEILSTSLIGAQRLGITL